MSEAAWSILINAATAVGTVLAVMVALFHGPLISWYRGPVLEVESDPRNPAEHPRVGIPNEREFTFFRVVIRNRGRGPALNCRARMTCQRFPNPIYLRWSGTVGEDQKKQHITPGMTQHLDMFVQTKEQEGPRVRVATYDDVVDANGGMNPFGLPVAGTDSNKTSEEEFILELFNDQRIWGPYRVILKRGDRTTIPLLTVSRSES